jgi:hypothetical protein
MSARMAPRPLSFLSYSEYSFPAYSKYRKRFVPKFCFQGAVGGRFDEFVFPQSDFCTHDFESTTYHCRCRDTVFNFLTRCFRSRDIATGYGLDDQGAGVRVPVGSRIFFLSRPDRLWGPPNLLSTGYRGLCPGDKAAWAWSWSLTSN